VLFGLPSIGGRYSALSDFGMVPAALMGLDLGRLLESARGMARACAAPASNNPGAALGAILGVLAGRGRDKVTLVASPGIHDLGAWLEQLLAESTGKIGKGLIPVDREPLGPPEVYGGDRLFAYLRLHSAPDAGQDRAMASLQAAGQPVVRIDVPEPYAIAAEFFRWEFATAVAGAVLGINPFDEPNVAEAKEKTKAILASADVSGGSPAASAGGVSVFSSRFSGSSPAQVVRNAVASIADGDYVGFLSYLPPLAEVEAAILAIRVGIRARTKAASTFGVGPRYLHSTGQYHKGGPNRMLAFVITGEDATETPVPDSPYSFKQLKRAQAVGDYQTLEAHDRRTVRIHLDRGVDPASALRTLFS
jgi:hypothetical protein